jgi:hypothetical protein
MTFFSIFSCFSRSAGQAPRKSSNTRSYGNLQERKFLKYLKKLELANYQECREKRSFANKFSFFFASLWKKETTKPALHSLRSLRLGITIFFLDNLVYSLIYLINLSGFIKLKFNLNNNISRITTVQLTVK